MSKNTQIGELINYISVDGSGNVVLSSGQLVATQNYVSTAITNLVNSAPSTLDTLNELALALGSDPNFATTMATSIGTKQAQLNGTGFVKISGTTISYDNSTYLTTGTASSTYQTILTNPVTGTGTSSYIPKFTGSSAIGNSLIYDTGSVILIGATTASDNQSKLELISSGGPIGLKIKSSGVNGNNTFLSIESSKEWRFVTNRGDLISGNQGDLIIRNNTDGINHIILNQNGTTNFYSSITVSGTVNAINTLNLYKTGGTTLGGQLAYDSAVNQLYLWNSISGGYFSIYTNTVERLTILATGELGIGVTPSAGNRFWVKGSSVNVGDTTLYLQNSAGTSLMTVKNNNTTHIGRWTGGGESLNVDTTMAVRANLTGNEQTIFHVGNTGSGVNDGFMRLLRDGVVKVLIAADNSRGGDTYFNGGGNVAIGTDSASQKLHVKSGTNYQGILINGSNAPAIGFAKGDGTTPEWKLGISGNDGTAISISSGAANTDKIIIGASGRVGINDGVSTNAQLALNGSVKINRSLYNWYQESYNGNSTYLHIKTNLWTGGSPNGNTEYTMSLFKGYMYAYGSPPALEGTIVFHNWDGNFYNIGTTGNLFVTAYRSTDGYVVLVTNSGSGEAGLTIDWHQAYGYPYKDRIRTASKLHGATTGGY